jgi:hypothetical protein
MATKMEQNRAFSMQRRIFRNEQNIFVHLKVLSKHLTGGNVYKPLIVYSLAQI